jgi:GWxTD domain-containing protein
MELSMSDYRNKDNPFSTSQFVEINYPEDKISISDIQLLESYKKAETPNVLTKSGYDLVPYVSNYYPGNLNKIVFYAEIYNTDKVLGIGEKYLLNFYIESQEIGGAVENNTGFLRQTANAANVLLSEFNISELPSGNYNLTIEVKNKNNELIAGKQLFFQRNNPDLIIKPEDITAINISESFVDKINSKDTLAEYIRSLHPITTESERGFIFNQLVGADIKMMQQFFYSFWKKRNSLNPESEWKKYKEQVVYTQKHFSTKIKKGYETDRGRVYLKYGPPNTIVDRPSEPGAYPYQFWHYYKTQIRGNSKFVFWNQDLVTNDYELLHSNVAGEVMNYRWQYMLSKRDNPNLNLDDPKGADRWGNWNDDFYDMPR